LPEALRGGIVAVVTAISVSSEETVGMLVKRWRERRRRSQLDVSLAADLSAKHLSYIETGRSNPSRDMIERICDELDVPLRERNRFYLAAGFAPLHRERPLADLGAAQEAVEAVLKGMEPNPAVAVNVCWDLLATNQAARAFLGGLPDELAGPPVNMLRATLHPDGMARQVRNLNQWRTHVLRRVRRQLERTAADGLSDLPLRTRELRRARLSDRLDRSGRRLGDPAAADHAVRRGGVPLRSHGLRLTSGRHPGRDRDRDLLPR
jgi:transcriptional regulator with XRE-family HTH domain